MNVIHDALAEQPFFEGFSDRELERLSRCARRSMFHPGTRLFDEGGRADRFWLIQRGAVRLYVTVPGRGDVAVETLTPQAVLGWSWLFGPHRWRFGGVAGTPVRAIEFDGRLVRTLGAVDPSMGYELTRRFAGLVVDRLEATQARLMELSGTARGNGALSA